MFGRKSKLPSQQIEELKNIKQQIVNPPAQPTAPVGTGSVIQQMQQPKKSPFVVTEKIIQQRQKSVVTPSGQVIYSNEMETLEVVNPVFEMTLEDLVDIVAMCRGTQVGMKFRNLLERGFT
jgi:hypothetical protein